MANIKLEYSTTYTNNHELKKLTIIKMVEEEDAYVGVGDDYKESTKDAIEKIYNDLSKERYANKQLKKAL